MSHDGGRRIDDPERLAAVVASGLLDSAPEPAFDELATLAARLLRAPFAFVTVVDARRSYWKSRIGVAEDGPTQSTVEESFCQYVVDSGEPLVEGDVVANPRTARNPSIESLGVRAWAGFPLTSRDGQPLGSFCVVDTVVREWTPADVETLRVLAAAAGREVALRSMVSESGAVTRHLGLLAQAGHTLAGTLDAHEAVARLAALAVPHLGDWSLVSLVDEDGVMTDVGWWHADRQLLPVLNRLAGARHVGLAGEGATYAALRGRQPVIVASGALAHGLALLRSERARAAYQELAPELFGVWPLAFGDAVHGVLLIARDRGRGAFTQAEIDLAAGLADRGGSVLENARLYERQARVSVELEVANTRLREAGRHDSDVARALQEAMLPRLPEPGHVELAARYLAADDHDKVGGDWFDALAPEGGATTLVIGDVAGHDIDAAGVMGRLRNVLRTLAWEHDDEPPAALLTRLDRAMADLDELTMATLLVARIERAPIAPGSAMHELRWSSAGHPAAVLIDAEARADAAGRGRPAMAAARNAVRHDHAIVLGPGETLLLYTDGLVETRNDPIDQRFERLLAVLGAAAGQPLDAVLDAAVAGMVGDARADDVALIAVRLPTD